MTSVCVCVHVWFNSSARCESRSFTPSCSRSQEVSVVKNIANHHTFLSLSQNSVLLHIYYVGFFVVVILFCFLFVGGGAGRRNSLRCSSVSVKTHSTCVTWNSKVEIPKQDEAVPLHLCVTEVLIIYSLHMIVNRHQEAWSDCAAWMLVSLSCF